MRVCICDDILEYRIAIRSYVENYFKTNKVEYVIDECDSGNMLLEMSSKRFYDIFFIDIELGDSNGLNIIKRLMERCQNSIFIIVTAYNQYLDDAMDLQVLRYINKPIIQNRINSALDRAIDRINNSTIVIKAKGGEQIYLNKREIIYMESKFKMTYILTTKGEIISSFPLKYYKELLSSPDFLIPHNSFIININYIASFKRTKIVIFDSADKLIDIPISAPKQHNVRNILANRERN